MTRQEIAAFDVDGTLTRGDCVLPFLVRVAGRARVAAALARCAPLLLAAKRDRARRDEAKEALVAGVLAGRPAAQVDGQGAVFASAIVADRLRPEVVERLRWHLAAGHEVVLVTASLAPYALPLGAALGARHVLATRLEGGTDGLLTGRLLGANCRADEKVRRLRAIYGDDVRLGWAYGDSPDDAPMLALADHGVRLDETGLDRLPA